MLGCYGSPVRQRGTPRSRRSEHDRRAIRGPLARVTRGQPGVTRDCQERLVSAPWQAYLLYFPSWQCEFDSRHRSRCGNGIRRPAPPLGCHGCEAGHHRTCARLAALCWWRKVPVSAEPEDQMAAAAAGRSRLRASHADREHVIDMLKAAYAHGGVTKHTTSRRSGPGIRIADLRGTGRRHRRQPDRADRGPAAEQAGPDAGPAADEPCSQARRCVIPRVGG